MKNAEHPIRSIEDIVKTSYQVGVRASSSTAHTMKYSKYETHQKIWQRIERDGTQAESLDQGVQWVREKDKFVYMTDGPLLQHVANQPPCDVKVGKYHRKNLKKQRENGSAQYRQPCFERHSHDLIKRERPCFIVEQAWRSGDSAHLPIGLSFLVLYPRCSDLPLSPKTNIWFSVTKLCL